MADAHRPVAPPEPLGAPLARGAEAFARTPSAENWDRHVRHADELSRSPGFWELRDRILSWRRPPRTIGPSTSDRERACSRWPWPRCTGVWAIDVAPAMVEHLRWLVAGRI